MNYIQKLGILIDENNVKPELQQAYEDVKELLLREETIEEVIEKAPFSDTYYCPICNNHVESGSDYCPTCASKMGWSLLWNEE